MPYLIDGNNLLGSWKTPPGGEDARLEVVRRVAAFCRQRGAKVTLVFDGRPFRSDLGAQSLGSLAVRFPPQGADADSVIKQVIERAQRPRDWIVVTSDKALYSYCKTLGASILRIHEWNALLRRPVAGPGGASGSSGSEKPEREEDVDAWLKIFSPR